MYSTTYLILQRNIDQSWRQNKTQILPHHCPFQLVRHCQNKKLQGWDIRGGVGFIAASKLWISWSYLGLTGQTEEQDKYQLNSHVKTTQPRSEVCYLGETDSDLGEKSETLRPYQVSQLAGVAANEEGEI